MAPVEQLTTTVPETDAKLVSALLSYGLSSYQFGKAVALAQAPAVETALTWVEDKVVSSAALGLKQVSLTPETALARLDGKAAEVVTKYELDAKYKTVKTEAAKQILRAKGEDPITASLAEEIELQQLIADARELAWTRVEGLQTQASDRADQLLSKAEGGLDYVLPAEEEEEAPAEEAADAGTKVGRVRSLSTKASRRFKKKAMSKLEGAKLQLRKSTTENPIVHLDLVRYSELLDLAAVRERVNTVSETVQATQTYVVVKGYVVQAVSKTQKIADDVKPIVEVRVLAPAKEYYAVLTAEFIKRKESAGDLYKLGTEEVQTRRVSTEKYLESVKTALGAAWDERLYKPTLAFLDACETEFAPFKRAYREGVENPNVTTPDGKPYTIDAGLEAFVTALRMKLSEEWETRVVPALDKLKAKVASKQRKENDELFVDASE